jgi:hypothetical protein
MSPVPEGTSGQEQGLPGSSNGSGFTGRSIALLAGNSSVLNNIPSWLLSQSYGLELQKDVGEELSKDLVDLATKGNNYSDFDKKLNKYVYGHNGIHGNIEVATASNVKIAYMINKMLPQCGTDSQEKLLLAKFCAAEIGTLAEVWALANTTAWKNEKTADLCKEKMQNLYEQMKCLQDDGNKSEMLDVMLCASKQMDSVEITSKIPAIRLGLISEVAFETMQLFPDLSIEDIKESCFVQIRSLLKVATDEDIHSAVEIVVNRCHKLSNATDDSVGKIKAEIRDLASFIEGEVFNGDGTGTAYVGEIPKSTVDIQENVKVQVLEQVRKNGDIEMTKSTGKVESVEIPGDIDSASAAMVNSNAASAKNIGSTYLNKMQDGLEAFSTKYEEDLNSIRNAKTKEDVLAKKNGLISKVEEEGQKNTRENRTVNEGSALENNRLIIGMFKNFVEDESVKRVQHLKRQQPAIEVAAKYIEENKGAGIYSELREYFLRRMNEDKDVKEIAFRERISKSVGKVTEDGNSTKPKTSILDTIHTLSYAAANWASIKILSPNSKLATNQGTLEKFIGPTPTNYNDIDFMEMMRRFLEELCSRDELFNIMKMNDGKRV